MLRSALDNSHKEEQHVPRSSPQQILKEKSAMPGLFSAFLDALFTTQNAGKKQPEPIPSPDKSGFYTTDGDGKTVFVSPTPGGVDLTNDSDDEDGW
jgi:hypothetical protein